MYQMIFWFFGLFFLSLLFELFRDYTMGMLFFIIITISLVILANSKKEEKKKKKDFSEEKKKQYIKNKNEHMNNIKKKSNSENFITKELTELKHKLKVIETKYNDQHKYIKSLEKQTKSNIEDTEIYKFFEEKLYFFKDIILKKSDEIKILKKKLIDKENENRQLIEELDLRLKLLEKGIKDTTSMNKLQSEKKETANILVNNKGLNQSNGLLVQRESFDDF